MKTRQESIPLKVYEALLRLYPAPYRRAYGPLMKQMFADMLRDYRAGTVWLTLVWDVPISALGEHIDALNAGENPMQKRLPGVLTATAIPVLLAGLIVASWKNLDGFGMWSAGFLLLVTITCLAVWLVVPAARHPPVPPRFGWLRPGLGAGLAVGLLTMPYANGLIEPEPGAFMISMVVFLAVMPIVFGLAGFASGRASQQARQGLFAGAFAAAVSAAILFAGAVVVMTVLWPTMGAAALQDPEMASAFQSSGIPTFEAFMWTVRTGSAEGMSIFLMLFGVAMGMLGGLIGSASRRRLRIVIV